SLKVSTRCRSKSFNCLGKMCARFIKFLRVRGCSMSAPTLDNFVLDRIFQRCSVHRSLSGVDLLLGAANVGGYRSCQHSWHIRTFLLAIYMAHLSFLCISSTFTGTFLLLIKPITFAPEVFKGSGPLPLGCSFPPLTHRADGFPVLRLLSPFRHEGGHRGFHGSLTFPLYFSIPLRIPSLASRVHSIELK